MNDMSAGTELRAGRWWCDRGSPPDRPIELCAACTHLAQRLSITNIQSYCHENDFTNFSDQIPVGLFYF